MQNSGTAKTLWPAEAFEYEEARECEPVLYDFSLLL